MAAQPQSAFREGVVSGFLGATAVAVWFFIIDVIRGDPLLVPAGLGHGMLHALGITGVDGRIPLVVAYTILHYVAFILVGWMAAAVLHRGERHPSVLIGALLLFVVFEVTFFALSSIIARVSTLGTPGWLLVLIGNLIAALVMGAYLWRAHRGAMAGAGRSIRGDDDTVATP